MNLGTRDCGWCGEKIELKITRDVHRKRFCSRSCSTKFNLAFGRCGMVGKRHSEETKQKISKIRKKNGLAKGENNPRYIDGRRMFRERVVKKFPKECFICRKTKNLIAHHIKPCERSTDKGRAPLSGDHTADNGALLCASCHKSLHNRLRGVLSLQKSNGV